ncbi:MAG: hypothetical protein ACI8P3_000995 [Saprospiraceae bacterium]|jgi:hypothetical protein
MKRIIWIFPVFIFFSISFLTAQNLTIDESAGIKSIENQGESKPCGTPSMTAAQRKYTLEVVDKAGASRNTGTTCIPIRIHIVQLDGGTGGISLGDVNIGMSYLNKVYLTAGIEYYICAVNYINSTAWYTFDDTEEAAMTAAHSVDDAINIYFVDDINSGAFCGYAYYPANGDYSINVLMDNSCVTSYENGTLVHELGHFFNLAHTHNDTENGNIDPDAEHVPRSGGNSNCTTAGDMLCDTEADPNGSNDGSCNFINDGVSTQDIHGNTYTPDLDNIMSYYSDYCGGIFTTEQYTRISNGLTTRLAHTAYNLDGCAPATVTDPSGMTATLNNAYGVDLSWTDNAGNETGYLIERSSDGGTTYAQLSGAGVAPDVTTYTDNTVSANTTYHYRVKASNDDCNHYSAAASVAVGLVYCVPTHQSNSCLACGGTLPIAINDFLFEETNGTDLIDNNASGCTGALSVFSGSYSAPVVAGTTYDFEADFRFSGSWCNQYVTIWVDNNQDGDFEDSGEMLYQAGSAVGPTATGSITIPATATNGTTTLRIRSGWSSGGTLSDPCNYHALGETEDYELVVSGSLPVDLVAFSGKKVEKQVHLEWITASEENNDFFMLERSIDGRTFEAISTIQGAGSTFENQRYFYIDKNPITGVNYYRLKQVDFDGAEDFADNIVAVEFYKGSLVTITPNPTKSNAIGLNYTTAQEGEVLVAVYDLTGRMIHQDLLLVEKGENSFSLKMDNLQAGMYLFRTSQDQNTQTLKFVKTN